MFASSYPMLDIFFTMLWFMLFFFWIILVFHIIADIFRSHDLGGGMKALWVLFILILPLLGTLIYLIARGGSMQERQIQAAAAQQKQFDDYIRNVANTKE